MTRSRAGFSLLEAIVALAIAGVLAVTVLGTLRATLEASSRAEAGTERMALAEYCLARLQLVPAADLVRLPDSLRDLRLPAPYSDTRCEAATTPVRGVRNLYQVRVQVTRDGSSTALLTRLYRPPLQERTQ